MKKDLEEIKNGNFKSKENNELKLIKPKEAIEKDKKMLEYLQNLKLFNTEYNEHAADFIDRI